MALGNPYSGGGVPCFPSDNAVKLDGHLPYLETLELDHRPRQSRWLERCEPLKAVGQPERHLKVALPREDIELVEALVLRLLLLDVLPDRGLIAAHRGDVVALGPKALACEVSRPAAQVRPGYVNGTLAFHIPRSPGPPHTSGRILTCGRGPPGDAPPPPQTLALLGRCGTPGSLTGTCGAPNSTLFRRDSGIHTTWHCISIGVASLAVVHGVPRTA